MKLKYSSSQWAQRLFTAVYGPSSCEANVWDGLGKWGQ